MTPLDVLHEIGRRFPTAWRQFDEFRAQSAELGGWPDWCFCPLAGAYAILSGGGAMPPGGAESIGVLGALAAWRPTQGVYRFDPGVLADIMASSIVGDIPSEVLTELPEWCVFVDLGRTEIVGLTILGFWAHLEHDANDGRRELRFVLLLADGTTVPVPLHLRGDLDACVRATADESAAQAALGGASMLAAKVHGDVLAQFPRLVEPLVACVLYLATDDAEIEDAEGRPIPRPNRPTTAKKKGRVPRMHAAPAPTEWRVGYRLGERMRAAREAASASVAPHIRRGHWHTYRVGAGRTGRKVRWLAPIPVGFGDGEP